MHLSDGQEVRITGCTSLDHPVERGVRYRLSFDDGRTEVVELEWRDGRLHTKSSQDLSTALPSESSFGLNGHPTGLVELSGLHSAIDLSTAMPEDFEVLLSRIVRATVGAA